MPDQLHDFDVRVFKDQLIVVHFDGYHGSVCLNFKGEHPTVIVTPADGVPAIVTSLHEREE